MSIEVRYRSEIAPMLRELRLTLAEGTAQRREAMEEAGALMASEIVLSMEAQVGMSDGAAYTPLSERYAKHKGTARTGRTLFGPTGLLKASWRTLELGTSRVLVGAGISPLEAIKASAHDGGMADYLKRPELDRLRIGWRQELADKVANAFMDKVVGNAEKRAPGGL